MSLQELLNVREISVIKDGVLGPYERVCVWFQGCSLKCPGCLVPEHQPKEPFMLMNAKKLFNKVNKFGLKEITLSGGEPFEQPKSEFLGFLKLLKSNDFGIWVYSGYTLDEIKKNGYRRHLEFLDTLVDGRYNEMKNNNQPLKGSENQRILFFTDRYKNAELPGTRKIQFNVKKEQVSMIGVPPVNFWEKFREKIK